MGGSTAGRRPRQQCLQGFDLLCQAHLLRCGRQAEDFSHSVEQRIRTLRPNAADAVLPVAGEEPAATDLSLMRDVLPCLAPTRRHRLK